MSEPQLTNKAKVLSLMDFLGLFEIGVYLVGGRRCYTRATDSFTKGGTEWATGFGNLGRVNIQIPDPDFDGQDEFFADCLHWLLVDAHTKAREDGLIQMAQEHLRAALGWTP